MLQRPAAGDERQARPDVLDHGEPCGVELLRRRGRASPRHAIGLLDEDDADALRVCGLPRGDEVGRLHAAAGAVTEDEQGTVVVRALHVGASGTVRRLDVQRRRHGSLARFVRRAWWRRSWRTGARASRRA